MPHGTPSGVFSRMFPQLDPLVVDDTALIQLASAMRGGAEGPDSTIPAGYTYLGQFIDHDITRANPNPDDHANPTSGNGGPSTPVDPTRPRRNHRSPSLDLDSLYRGGPGSVDALDGMYEPDGLHLSIGQTVGTGAHQGRHPNDLPRRAGGAAIIGDDRNDENLAVAQTHLAFLKLHNHVVDVLIPPSVSPSRRFARARRIVTHNYQWVVLNDFLPRLVDNDVLADVVANGSMFYTGYPDMPIEFSVAAYRFGHSMVRERYDWNRVFPNAGLDLLFGFTGRGGFLQSDPEVTGQLVLPSDWIADWTRLYDFAEISVTQGHRLQPEPNRARSIDTRITEALFAIERPTTNLPPINLPLVNLRRGVERGLPSGQTVARLVSSKVPSVATMGANRIFADLDGGVRRELEAAGLHEATPLWYYILREAEVLGVEGRLGPVGSRIVAEVFVELIRHSRHSILEPGFSFDRDTMIGASAGGPTMTWLIAASSSINPVGT